MTRASLALLVTLAACGADTTRAELIRTSTASLSCVRHVTDAMRGADGCRAKIAAADLVAQTNGDCRAAGLTELGLTCPDGGAP